MPSNYNGFYEATANTTNRANLKSLNLGQFDRLRCELQSAGVDRFGSEYIAKEMLAQVKAGTFTFAQAENLVKDINRTGLSFQQMYLDALNKQRDTTSRLDLVGDKPIPENVSRAIIF